MFETTYTAHLVRLFAQIKDITKSYCSFSKQIILAHSFLHYDQLFKSLKVFVWATALKFAKNIV